MTKTTFADGTFIKAAYDAIGSITSTTDARGNTTTYDYDPNCGCSGRRPKITDGLGHVTSFTYDGNGNQLSMTDALSHTTIYEYDLTNRRTKTNYADSTFDNVVYDAVGRNLSKTDQAGRTTQFSYDALGRLTKGQGRAQSGDNLRLQREATVSIFVVGSKKKLRRVSSVGSQLRGGSPEINFGDPFSLPVSPHAARYRRP